LRAVAETAGRQTLLIIADTANGGLASAARAEAEWFSTRGWSVTIAAPGKIAAGGSVLFRHLGVPYRTRDVRGILQAVRQVRQLLRETRPSIVHAHGTKSLLVARLGGSSAYLTLHGLPWAQSTLGSSLRRTGVTTAGALARRSFSVSPELHDERWEFVAHASPRLASLAHLAPPSSEHPLFLWIGALQDPKRPEMFIEALTRAARLRPMRGIIAGSGPSEEATRNLVRRRGAPIDVMPYTEGVAGLYERSTAIVLTSASEGVPFVLEEAMWSGRAVIASDLPGTRWLLGDTGRLVRSESDLVRALVDFSSPETAASSGRDCGARVRRLLAPDAPWPATERAFVRDLSLDGTEP